MPYIETLRALIREKEAELARLEAELVGGRAYVQLLEERVAAAEQRQGEIPEADDPVVSVVTILAASGHPLFIDEILDAMGQTVSRDSREQLRRILLPWVRRGEIFTRPRPATFGLAEWQERDAQAERS